MSNSRVMNDDNKNDTNIKSEVKKLLKEGYNIDSNLISYLRGKYSDNAVVDIILDEFRMRKTKLEKIAKHFINKFQEKYGSGLAMNVILKKLLKYKKKYDLSDDEFYIVKSSFEKDFYNENKNKTVSNMSIDNNMSKVLGSPYIYNNDSLRPSSNDDFKNVQEIIKQNKLSQQLYTQIVVQTSTYENFNPTSLFGKFNIDRHSPNVYIHPVLVALFTPKLYEVEMRMLYSNIAEIVESRYEKKQIDTEPNSRLLYYLVNDPSDIVCSSRSPLEDLKERSAVQIQLWENVLNLRNGKYYDVSSTGFLNVIDRCKISNFDNPDLVMLGDEGVVLRRLFNVFSFRPIVVQTMPIIGNIVNNPYSIPIINNVISTLPYITYRISSVGQENGYTLENSKTFLQFYFENKTFVPKTTNILYIYGPLVFYIPRRFMNIPIIMPPSVMSLPMTKHSNLKTITTNVDIPKQLNINTNINVYLKSIVCIEPKTLNTFSNNNVEQIILGHNTYLFRNEYDASGIHGIGRVQLYCYSPHDVLKKQHLSAFESIIDSDAIAEAKQDYETLGTIVIYDK